MTLQLDKHLYKTDSSTRQTPRENSYYFFILHYQIRDSQFKSRSLFQRLKHIVYCYKGSILLSKSCLCHVGQLAPVPLRESSMFMDLQHFFFNQQMETHHGRYRDAKGHHSNSIARLSLKNEYGTWPHFSVCMIFIQVKQSWKGLQSHFNFLENLRSFWVCSHNYLFHYVKLEKCEKQSLLVSSPTSIRNY